MTLNILVSLLFSPLRESLNLSSTFFVKSCVQIKCPRLVYLPLIRITYCLLIKMKRFFFLNPSRLCLDSSLVNRFAFVSICPIKYHGVLMKSILVLSAVYSRSMGHSMDSTASILYLHSVNPERIPGFWPLTLNNGHSRGPCLWTFVIYNIHFIQSTLSSLHHSPQVMMLCW